MSLDVCLYIEKREGCCAPDCDEHVKRERVYDDNITHNLGVMAKEAGIYEYLWRPDELGITKAKELVDPLLVGWQYLASDPVRFKKFDASNGYGVYNDFCRFVEEYLAACESYPEADVEVSR